MVDTASVDFSRLRVNIATNDRYIVDIKPDGTFTLMVPELTRDVLVVSGSGIMTSVSLPFESGVVDVSGYIEPLEVKVPIVSSDTFFVQNGQVIQQSPGKTRQNLFARGAVMGWIPGLHNLAEVRLERNDQSNTRLISRQQLSAEHGPFYFDQISRVNTKVHAVQQNFGALYTNVEPGNYLFSAFGRGHIFEIRDTFSGPTIEVIPGAITIVVFEPDGIDIIPE